MPENDKPLSPRQRRTIGFLLSAATAKDAARDAGISERTIRRWLSDPVFLNALKAAESDVLASAARRLASISGSAINVLSSVMHDDENPAAARNTAALGVLTQMVKLRELHDLEARVSALEAERDKPKHRR